MAGIQYRDILKGFCRFQGILITAADVLCHGDVNDILRLRQLFRKEPLIVLHIRRLRVPCTALRDMYQQLVGIQLLFIQKTPLVGTDIVVLCKV